MQTHYNVIIIGDSLAARIAGVQLVRGGSRVLTIEEGQALSPAWFTSSLQLENLLEQLSGRPCLTTPSAFQVITPTARVELASRQPLDEVLLREFPADSATLLEFFNALQKRGEQLEATLAKNIIPLKGFGGHLRFRWQALRSGLGLAANKRALSTHLKRMQLTPASSEFLQTLFTGLSLSAFEHLTLAEAALLWCSHTREHGASASGLDNLLRQRYEQFHGHSEPLENFRQIDATAQQVKQVVLKNGSSCTADYYLIASPTHLAALAPTIKYQELRLPLQPARVVTSELHGTPSPLLSRRVILSGAPPLRLSFGRRGDNTLCAIDTPGHQAAPDGEQLKAELLPILPFCRYELNEMPRSATGGTSTNPPLRSNLFGQQASVRLLRNTLLCHGASILPSLGTGGEVLLGTRLASYILARRPKK